ncbi:hypothetical protein FC83_GL002066 [Agrilactobacillus composti DSM 18527 = JCM 14202]|uniref:Major facilitator superfamily (MFS) profile domain-containing protein n=1 Tax=Agrilactobacillus composti DSM 18527 = JCM 14202 TaxID=1423734 RepID=X0PMR3_9LACO|nr:MFS transporter [Agrilactobacillus composti]KRM34926.1 hypothetical protein FC83_GL002066 [Agrilactobacillus composti DSM 18527 = JCM 14202]GAF38812.1 major facilitator family transporter [Agrilactobacillus composti DSM 18527 = JCM 14202]
MIQNVFLIFAFLTSIFTLGTDNLIIAPLLSQIAKTMSSTPQYVSFGITLYSGAYGVFAIVLAPISDIFGRKRTIGVSGFTFGICSIVLAFCSSGWLFLMLRFLTGLSAAVLGPGLWAYCADNFKAHKREMMISWMMSFFSLATVLGIPIGLLISKIFNWQIIFLFTGIIMLFSVGIFYIYGITTKQASFSIKKHFSNISKAFSLNGQLNISMLFSSGAYMVVYAFLSVWIQSISHFNSIKLAWLFFLIGIMSFLGSIISGQLLRKFAAFKLVAVAWLFQVLLITSILFLFKLPILLACVFSLWAFMVNFGNSAFVNMISETTSDLRGSVMALNNSSIFLGFTLGSMMGSLAMAVNHTLLSNIIIAEIFGIIAFLLLHRQLSQKRR